MLEGRAPHPTGLPPPETSATSTTTKPSTRRPLAKVNPNKDVSNQGSFWGGVSGLGGVASVHHAIVPDIAPNLASVLAQKPIGGLNGGRWIPVSTATLGTLPGYAGRSTQENINPNLNSVFRTPVSPPTSGSDSSSASPSSPSSGSESGPSTPPMASCDISPLSLVGFNQQQMQQWNGLGDINPFTIKSLDSYRLQLWAKMAAAGQLPGYVPQQPQQQPQPLQPTYNNVGTPSSLASQLRPAWFETDKDKENVKPAAHKTPVGGSASPLSALMAGKAASSLSSSSSPASSSSSPAPSPQVHLAAALASQSLVSRMGSAFMDAFGTPTASASNTKNWDMEKVRKVLEGKAVLKVVDVEPASPKVAPLAKDSLGLEEKMRSLSLSTGMTRDEREREQAHRPGGVLKHLLK